MSQSVQAVTLSLTLPLSCQICLGKVRKPMICCNNHVFCSACIDIWLKKSSQCPTCRVPITAENPCREIIGATNDSDFNENHSIKKRLRKTRGELLLREYEDEIETLLKENEDLKSKNLSLETQLKTALEPGTISASQSESQAVDAKTVEGWVNKLKAADELYKKVKHDMDKLKEANKTLRSQTVDLIQENLHLKAEVESRSPQKFGRFTVAALEAKIIRYEREMTQLKRALERSDKYIEELEAQVALSRREPAENAPSDGAASGEKPAEYSRIVAMRRSLSEMEETSVCTERDGKSADLSANCGFLLTTSDSSQGTLGNVSVPRTPSTPSSALGGLRLMSPASERTPGFKRLPYLRRLSFDDSGSTSCFGASSKNDGLFDQRLMLNPAKDVLWGGWRDSASVTLPCTDEDAAGFKPRASERRSPSKEATGHGEASMDAAYLDKISELDSMMDDGESSRNQTSQLTLMLSHHRRPDSDTAMILEPEADRSAGRRVQTSSTRQGGVEASSTSSCDVSAAVCGAVEASGESSKRKCPVGVVTSSPSKVSRSK